MVKITVLIFSLANPPKLRYPRILEMKMIGGEIKMMKNESNKKSGKERMKAFLNEVLDAVVVLANAQKRCL